MSKTSKLPQPMPDPDTLVASSARWEHAVIDRFLRAALNSVERSLNDHRAQAMTDRTDRLRGILEYLRHQKSTLIDLISRNHSSGNAKSPRRSD